MHARCAVYKLRIDAAVSTLPDTCCFLCVQFWLIQWAIPGLGMFCEVLLLTPVQIPPHHYYLVNTFTIYAHSLHYTTGRPSWRCIGRLL